jgi:hypothetical protein
MNPDPHVHTAIQDVEPKLGHRLGEFPDLRAAVLQGVGVILAVLGALVMAVRFLSEDDSLANFGGFGVTVIAVGAAAFSLGTWRRTKRLAVYAGGFVVKTWGMTSAYLWQDIKAIALDQALTSHHVRGLPILVTSRTKCMLQQMDGAWIPLSFPLLSSEAHTALQESWERWCRALPGDRACP